MINSGIQLIHGFNSRYQSVQGWRRLAYACYGSFRSLLRSKFPFGRLVVIVSQPEFDLKILVFLAQHHVFFVLMLLKTVGIVLLHVRGALQFGRRVICGLVSIPCCLMNWSNAIWTWYSNSKLTLGTWFNYLKERNLLNANGFTKSSSRKMTP